MSCACRRDCQSWLVWTGGRFFVFPLARRRRSFTRREHYETYTERLARSRLSPTAACVSSCQKWEFWIAGAIGKMRGGKQNSKAFSRAFSGYQIMHTPNDEWLRHLHELNVSKAKLNDIGTALIMSGFVNLCSVNLTYSALIVIVMEWIDVVWVVKSKSESFRKMLLQNMNFRWINCLGLSTFPIDQCTIRNTFCILRVKKFVYCVVLRWRTFCRLFFRLRSSAPKNSSQSKEIR